MLQHSCRIFLLRPSPAQTCPTRPCPLQSRMANICGQIGFTLPRPSRGAARSTLLFPGVGAARARVCEAPAISLPWRRGRTGRRPAQTEAAPKVVCQPRRERGEVLCDVARDNVCLRASATQSGGGTPQTSDCRVRRLAWGWKVILISLPALRRSGGEGLGAGQGFAGPEGGRPSRANAGTKWRAGQPTESDRNHWEMMAGAGGSRKRGASTFSLPALQTSTTGTISTAAATRMPAFSLVQLTHNLKSSHKLDSCLQ